MTNYNLLATVAAGIESVTAQELNLLVFRPRPLKPSMI